MKKDLAFLRELFTKQKFAALSTLDDTQPYQSLVAFTSTHDLKNLLFCTRRDTQKYSNIKKNARVALLIDNKSNSEKDFEQAIAVTALGTARTFGPVIAAGEGEPFIFHPHRGCAANLLTSIANGDFGLNPTTGQALCVEHRLSVPEPVMKGVICEPAAVG